MTETRDGLELRTRMGTFWSALPLIGFQFPWTMGCVMLLRQATSGAWFDILFGVPFWAGWLAINVSILMTLMGIETVRVGPAGLQWTRRVILRVGSRHVPREEVHGVRLHTVRDNENSKLEVIEIQTAGKPLRLAKGLKTDERRYLAHRIQQELNLDAASSEPVTGEPDTPEGPKRVEGSTYPMIWPADAPRSDPPSDSQYAARHTLDQLVFLKRGAWSLGLILGLTFFNVFWNGIVSVFLFGFIFSPQVGGGIDLAMRVGMGLFLVPFVGIGLLMIGLWLLAVLGPLGATRWTTDGQRFTQHLLLLGIPFPTARTRQLGSDWHVEVDRERSDEDNTKTLSASFSADETADWTYAVRMVSSGGDLLAKIDGLTRGEAEWIAGELLHA